MSYNATNDELFLADRNNKVVRAVRLSDNPSDLHDVHRVPSGTVTSVCHMSVSDTLLVCTSEQNKRWLVALSRSGSWWREAQRVEIETEVTEPMISCALNDSRVLVGQYSAKYLELFRIENGPRIAHVQHIALSEEYTYFFAKETYESGVLVAMSYSHKNEVRVHRLSGDTLEEIARTRVKNPRELEWLSDRVIATELHQEVPPNGANSVTELEVVDTQLDRSSQLFAPDEGFYVQRWCALNDGLAITNEYTKDILIYKFQAQQAI